MSFSVQREQTGLEYNGTRSTPCSRSDATCCARPFIACWRDILRFNRERRFLLEADDQTLTLGDYLAR